MGEELRALLQPGVECYGANTPTIHRIEHLDIPHGIETEPGRHPLGHQPGDEISGTLWVIGPDHVEVGWFAGIPWPAGLEALIDVVFLLSFMIRSVTVAMTLPRVTGVDGLAARLDFLRIGAGRVAVLRHGLMAVWHTIPH